MRVLIVIGCDDINDAPFVALQKKNLENLGVDCFVFPINKKGLWGYLRCLNAYWKTIKNVKPDVIHAHYALSGLFALFQFRKPVIISYIGSDVLVKKLKLLSWFTMLFTEYSIFVSRSLYEAVPFKKKNFRIIPYGIDLENFKIVEKQSARIKLGFHLTQIYCLFPSLKTRAEKNYALAEASINNIGGIQIIEMGLNLPIEELNLVYNACDFMLLTSLHEGGPQVIFEALATNLPIVSTDVGVVRESIKGLDGCYICGYNLEDVVIKIKKVLQFEGRTSGRERVHELNLDSGILIQDVIALYKTIENK